MKTSKFSYRVYFSDFKFFDVYDLSDYDHVDCVTLAEARLIACRQPYSCIICIGHINYVNGLEVL